MTSGLCESLSEDETDLLAERLSPGGEAQGPSSWRNRTLTGNETQSPSQTSVVLSIATGMLYATNAGNLSIRLADFNEDSIKSQITR